MISPIHSRAGTTVMASVLFLSFAPLECAQNNSTDSQKSPSDYSSLKTRDPRYQIARGDVLDISFPLVTEFNQTVTVLPDGFIGLKGIGSLHVAGQTTPELVQSLKTAYSTILKDPQITVDLKEFEKPYFIAIGKVGRPGKYDLRGTTTITQAVAIAGGFDDAAKHSQVMLFRRSGDDWVEVKRFDMKALLQAKNLNEDIVLQPGDLVYMPKSAWGKIGDWIPHTSIGVPIVP